MKISVYGSAAGLIHDEIREKAKEIGRELARKKCILITGACPGLPYEAVLGASGLSGKCIGFSPATDLKIHTSRDKFPVEGFSKIVFIPKEYAHSKDPLICRKYRNVSSVAESDAVIIIGGRTGTMNEFTIAYDFGKNIGILEGSGGITKRAIRVLLQDIDKDRGSKIIFDPDPIHLVDSLIELCKQ
jgi:predicted Rossmann-fold nucleotide-binding protein